MLAVIVCSLIMLSMLDRALRIGRLEVAILETKYELFALKDALRDAAIADAISIPLLKVLEHKLLGAIADLRNRHLSGVLGVILYEDLETGLDETRRFDEFLARPENSRAQCINTAYRKSMVSFMMQRHRIIMPLLHKLLCYSERKLNMLRDKLKEELKVAIYSKHPNQDDHTDLYQYAEI